MDVVYEGIDQHMNFSNVKKMRINKLKRFIRREHFKQELELHRVDCLSSHKDLSNFYFVLEKLQEFGEEEIHPPPLVSGHDLIELGYKPSPLFKKILTELEDKQLDCTILHRDEALCYIKDKYSDKKDC